MAANASGWNLAVDGLLALLIGCVGIFLSVVGKPWTKRGARWGNGIASVIIATAGAVLVVVGFVQAAAR
jgi:hypothetical protein